MKRRHKKWVSRREKRTWSRLCAHWARQPGYHAILREMRRQRVLMGVFQASIHEWEQVQP